MLRPLIAAIAVCLVAAPLHAAPIATLAVSATINVNENNDKTEPEFREGTDTFVALGLAAGRYSVTPVIGADFRAMSVWDTNSGCDQNTDICGQGFMWRVDVVSDSLVGSGPDTRANDQRIYLSSPGENWRTEQQAFDAAVAAGQGFFTLTADDTVFFGHYDLPKSDNRGGVAFTVAPAPIPLPAGGVVLMAALGLLPLLRKARR